MNHHCHRSTSFAVPTAILAALLVGHTTHSNKKPATPQPATDSTIEEPHATAFEDYTRRKQEAQDRYSFICATDANGKRRTKSVLHLTADCYAKGDTDMGCTAFTEKKTFGPGTFTLGPCS